MPSRPTANDRFVATAAQTEFTLSSAHVGTESRMFVNGSQYSLAVDYAISGTALTWLDTDFALEEGDIADVFYGT